MTFNQIKLNSKCMLYGKVYKVVSIDTPYVWLKRPDDEDLKIQFTALVNHPTFIPDHSMKQIKKEGAIIQSDLAKLSEKKREEVSERFNIIHPLILLEEIKINRVEAVAKFLDKYRYLLLDDHETLDTINQEEMIKRLQKAHNISRATIMRYLRNYRQAENQHLGQGLEGLISNKGRGYTGRKDNELLIINHPDYPDIILDTLTVRQPQELIEILKSTIEEDYLSKIRRSSAAIYRLIDRKCAARNIEPPPYNTVNGILNRIDKKARERLRNMKRAKAIYDEVARGYADRDALYRLDIVQIDHTQIDMVVLDDVTGLPIKRPWITIGICVHSREPWCLYISPEPPSANVVRKAIQHGIFPKNTIELFGTELEWEAFGIPNIIYVDNGLDFKSKDIHRLVSETLKSEIMHRPVKLPHYGAVIERLIGTINTELIHNIYGTTKSNIFQKGELEPEKDAVLTLNQLRTILIHYLTDIYPIRPHRGLGNNMTPLAKYRLSVSEVGYPDWIHSGEADRFKIEFLPTLKKPYTRDGIRWDNKIYKSPDGHELVGTRDLKYTVKYDVDDISKIYLLNPKSKDFVELFCESPPYDTVAGVNQYTFKILRKMLAEEGEEIARLLPGRAHMNRAWERIAKVVREGVNKKSVRNTLQRLEGVKVEVITAYKKADPMQSDSKNHATSSIEQELLNYAKDAEKARGKI